MYRFSSALFGFIFISCLLNTHIIAQNLSFQAFTAEDGLSKNYIGSISQDSRGLIWIASSQGLNVYDGYQFKTYYHQPSDITSLSDNAVYVVFTDHAGRLWVGTGQGINLYDAKEDSFIHFEGLKSHHIYCIYEDSQHAIWVGTDQGAFVLKEQGFQQITATQTQHVRAIMQKERDTFLLGSDEGLFTLNAPDKQISKVSSLQKVDYISAILSHQNKIWVATREEGVYTLNSQDLSVSRQYQHEANNPASLNANDVLSMLRTSDGELWVGTDLGGLHLLDSAEQGFIHYTSDNRKENSLSSNNILSLFEDKDQNLWVGTNYGGLNFVSRDNFFQYYKSNPYYFRSSAVHAVYEDEKAQLWVGSGGNGLSLMSQDGTLLKTYSSQSEDPLYKLGGNTVQSIAQDQYGRIWLGLYEQGINIIDPDRGVIKSFTSVNSGLQHDDVRNIWIDRHQRIWIATKGGGLHTYQPESGKIVKVDLVGFDDSQTNMLIWLYEDPAGKLWMGNFEGKSFYIEPDSSKSQTAYTLNPAPWKTLPSFISAMVGDKQGNYWIGSWDNGLFYWNAQQERMRHYGQEKGIETDKISGLLLRDDQLWVSSSGGLANYLPTQDSFKWYDHTSSLKYTDFIFGAAHQSRDATFYFGSGQGFYAFKPAQSFEKAPTHAVYLKDLKVMGESIKAGSDILPHQLAYTDTVNLSHQHTVFTIDFGASHYPQADRQRYAVKLEGFEEEWRDIGSETSTTYTNIKPGDYRFRVRLLDNYANDEKQEASVILLIHPPIWETPLAFVMYCVALLLMIYLARRFTIARIQLKNDLKQERKEREREEEIHQMKLSFFTGLSHEFRTPLMLIINPLEKLLKIKNDDMLAIQKRDAVMMERNAQRLLRLIKQLLMFRKMETSNDELHWGAHDLECFVQQILHNFEDLAERENVDFGYDIQLEQATVCFDAEKMETVLYNLLSNAFKFTPPQGKIRVSVLSETVENAEQILIKVEDNGIGIPQHLQQYVFDRYYQVDEHHMNGNSGTGIGLALVKKIVEMHKGTVSVESQEGQGSCFSVSMPLRKSSSQDQETAEVYTNEASSLLTADAVFQQENYTTEEEEHRQDAILLVDDNAEVRSYLKSVFSPRFQVWEASDGEEGLQVLAEHKPALIISDVMMPRMDGITFCKKVKSNLDTHHIPLILLTARTGEESMLQALRAGADDYLEKPVPLETLLLKMKNILAYRKEVRKELSRDLVPDPQIENHQSADQEFLEEAMRLVEENMENADFSVEEFAATMGVSKTHLYKKLKGLTGLSANEFTRSVRMKKAAALLEQERWSVSEVAYMVGFNNPNYFSKCFIKEYGISPSKFESHRQESEG